MSCDRNGDYTGIAHRVPEFLVGDRPQHLDLGYGWAGAIIHFNENCNVALVSVPVSVPCLEKDDGQLGIIKLRTVNFIDQYLRALRTCSKLFLSETHKNPLLLLLPILDIHAIYLYEYLIDADRRFRLGRASRQDRPDLVEEAWDALRMMRHDGMGPLNCIQQYDLDHNGGKVQNSNEYTNLVKRFRYIEEQISLVETLARDYLQHHVAMFSLEESRTSIVQSKVALEESRRTKLITVLAIFFVPISLSTSIFGMNINELNESGQSVWVFILTSILIVAITLIIWGFMYQLQLYNSLPKVDDENEEKPWLTRLGHLLELVLRGHIIWGWNSGILVSLLTDGRVAFLRSCNGGISCGPLFGPSNISVSKDEGSKMHDAHRPCDYITGHLRERSAFKCSTLEAIPEPQH